jgi:hypothetical protein
MIWAALDLSRHTGYAVFDGNKLIKHGVLEVEIQHYKQHVIKYDDLPEQYPQNLLDAANQVCRLVLELCLKEGVSLVVVEDSEPSGRRFSQRFLEWVHLKVFEKMRDHNIVFKYLLNSDWRKQTKCYMKHWPEFKEHNKKRNGLKKQTKPNKAGARVVRTENGVMKKLDQKDISLFVANQKYGLSLTDDNISDALNLGTAAIELGLF